MLPNIRKILYCTDLSEGAGLTLRYAVYLAKKTDAEIHILHVVEKLSSDAKITLESYMLDSDTRKRVFHGRVDHAKKQLKKCLEEFWKALEEKDREVSKQIASINVCEAYPREEIVNKADELDCDIIVMGTHEKGLMQPFLGSVAKSVLHHSHIPTMVVPLSAK